MDSDSVPLSYLLSASQEGLQNFEMKRLAHAANLEKDAKGILREAQHARDVANVARWLLENRDEILRTAGSWLGRAGGVDGAADAGGEAVAQAPRLQGLVEGGSADAAERGNVEPVQVAVNAESPQEGNYISIGLRRALDRSTVML